jgi:hypothetical protein
MDYEKTVAVAAGVAAVLLFVARWLWQRASKTPADPWPTEIDVAVRDREAVPLCINCLFPQEAHRWFCPHCGFPTGDYVAVMPYLQVFVVGEVLRKGVMGPPERRIGVQLFLVLYSLAEYTFFAPIYWFWMLRRALGKPICLEYREPVGDKEAEL